MTESEEGVAVESATPVNSRHERGLMLARIGVVVLLSAVPLLTLESFLRPIAWAGIVAFVSFGFYRRLRDWIGWPHTTAVFFTFLMLLVLGVPLGLVLALLSEQAVTLLQSIQGWINQGAALPSWLVDNRFIGPAIEKLRHDPSVGLAQIGPTLAQYGQAISNEVFTIASGVVGNLVSFMMGVITLYVFYIDGQAIVAAARSLMAYVFPSRPPEFVDHIGEVVRAVVFGIVGTAILEGVAAGIGFAICNVPYPVLLGAATTVVSFVPGGQFLIWASASAWLFLDGQTAYGFGMLVWGTVVIGSLDNFARPVLIRWSGSADIPFLLIMFGVLGGLASFGLIGLLLGPVILSVSFTLIRDLAHPEAAAIPAQGMEADLSPPDS